MPSVNQVLIGFRSASVLDAEPMAHALCGESDGYLKFFHPFPFTGSEIRRRIENAVRDRYVLMHDESNDRLIGFYMLRGLDEGYSEPMFGLYVCSSFSGIGIGALATQHAIVTCRLDGIRGLELKVYAENEKALRIYSELGFYCQSNTDGVVRMRKHWVRS